MICNESWWLAAERQRCPGAGPTVARRRQTGWRRGFTILELEVAMVLFGVALMGVCPLIVMYTKQLRNLQGRFNPQTAYYLVPSADAWTRKLGAAASVVTVAPGAPQPPGSSTPVNDVEIQSLEKSFTGEAITVYAQVIGS
ncbi:MAG TPA: prepilin-type N-terminal cleavage/methylation domain-containing protein [Pirellulales bacterium]|nr:prepilin-type N-terminal cleavage/methylation domain-containing protein [Pirellulales bacterium]